MSEKNAETTTRKKLVRLAKWLIALAVIGGLVYAAASAVDQWKVESGKLQQRIAQLQQQIDQARTDTERQTLLLEQARLQASVPTMANLNWQRIVEASLLYALALFPNGFVLAAAVRSLGERVTLATAMASQLLGHAGKYVPGKAMVVVLRVGAMSTEGVSAVTSTISVFMETLLMMAVGAAVACVVILWLPVPSWIMITAVLVAIGASIPTLPPILKLVAAKVAHRNPAAATAESNSSLRFFVVGWFWSLLGWMLIGAAFTVLVSAIPTPSALPEPVYLYAVCTAAIALAMVVGFASLLPGGAGVRELMLITLLALVIGTAHALLAAIAARLMFMVVEAISAAGAWWWLGGKSQGPLLSRKIAEDQSDEGGDDAPALQPE